MNDILGWEIDFTRDLRQGDTFKIVYEEMWKDGRLVRTGNILALECINRGRTHRAYRYEEPDGWKRKYWKQNTRQDEGQSWPAVPR